MRFAKQVQLHSSDGVLLRRLHAEDASRMVERGQAEPKHKGRVTVIVATRTTYGHPCKAPTVLTARHYMGKPQTYREPVGVGETIGYTTSLRLIPGMDRWAYRLSVTDCLRAGA